MNTSENNIFLKEYIYKVCQLFTDSPTELTLRMSCLRKSSMKALSEMISFWEGRGPSGNTKSTRTIQLKCSREQAYVSFVLQLR